MGFNLGKYRKIYGGPTYIRDTHQVQSVPTTEEIIQPKEEIKQPKKEKDESIQHGKVVQKPVSKGSKPVRRKGRPSSKSNRSSDSGS